MTKLYISHLCGGARRRGLFLCLPVLLPVLLALICAVSTGFTRAEDRTASVGTGDGEITARASIEPVEPTLGKGLILTIVAEHPSSYTMEQPNFEKKYGNFTVEETQSKAPAIANGVETSVVHVKLDPSKPGEAVLLPIPLEFHKGTGGDAETAFLVIPSGTVQISSQLDTDPALDDLSSAENPIKSFPWFLMCAVLLTAALVALMARKLVRRKPWEKHKTEHKAIRILTPSEMALAKLEELWASGVHKTDVRKFYLELTGTVRDFIEKTTGIRAPEQTTEEFLRAIESKKAIFPTEMRADIAKFLEFSDLVKFAKFHPGEDEIREGYENARQVVLHDWIAHMEEMTGANEYAPGREFDRGVDTSKIQIGLPPLSTGAKDGNVNQKGGKP